jgi:hypothetical protein
MLGPNKAGDVGDTSAKALAPGPIGAGAPGNPRPSLTDQAPIVPPSGGHNQKRLRLAAKQFDPIPHADQVMTQVKLPLYCGLHSPWIWLLSRLFLDVYLRCFTECHKPQLLVPRPRVMISLCKRNIVKYRS